jgi:hypothetical protein
VQIYKKNGQERIEKWKRATYQTNLGLSTRGPGPGLGPAHILQAKGSWGTVGSADPLPTCLTPILHVAAHSYSLNMVKGWILRIFPQNRPWSTI